jgi:hypothetical protein
LLIAVLSEVGNICVVCRVAASFRQTGAFRIDKTSEAEFDIVCTGDFWDSYRPSFSASTPRGDCVCGEWLKLQAPFSVALV